MRKYLEVDEDNKFMRQARRVAEERSLDPDWPTGAVVIRDGKVVGRGANGSEYHRQYGCRRKELGIKTGERYDLCEGCDPKNHAEQRAIQDADKTDQADLYLWGHWWCCENCWQVMIDAGIDKVYLLKNAKVVFIKKHKSVKA